MEVDHETAENLRRESNASRLRSSSVGAAPRPKRLFTTRAQSAAEAALDVRCACQFFQTTALLPERVNPVGSRPSSSIGFYAHDQEQLHRHHLGLQQDDAAVNAELEAVLGREDPLGGSDFSFGPVLGDMDYYAESVSSRPNSPIHRPLGEHPTTPILPPTGVGSSMELDPCLQPRSLLQKDPSTSILLQRRNSQTQLDPQHNLSPFAPTTPLKRNASQRSFEIVVAPICQRDPSTSSLVRKRMGQSHMASRSGSQYGLENSFIPIQAVAPLSSSVSPDSRRPRGPYPGEAYPPDYEHMDEYNSNTMESQQQPGEESKASRSFGIGIVDLMALGTSLIQSRKTRYTDQSAEEDRGRSRKEKRQERAEQAAQRKEEAREAKERAKREKEEDREIIRLAREEERLQKEAEREAERRNKEEIVRQKEAEKEAERFQKEEAARQREAEKEAERLQKEEAARQKEADKEVERMTKEQAARRIEEQREHDRLAKEEEAREKQIDLENERRLLQDAKTQIEAEKREKEQAEQAAKEEERRRSTASKLSERMQKEAAKQFEQQQKEAKREADKAAKEEARRQSAASKESERLARDAAKEEKRAAKEAVRLKKESEKDAERRAKDEIKALKESKKINDDGLDPIEPMVYIGQNVYIKDNPPKAKSKSPDMISPEAEEVVNYHEIVENVKVSVPVNTLIASLVHSNFGNPSSIRDSTPQVLPLSSERPSRSSVASDKESQFMRQRDPSQSSLLRSRYSQEPKDQQRQGSSDTDGRPQPMRQRDPSQSSLLRKRYPSGSIRQASEEDASSIPGPQFMHQRDPSQSSLLRKRYSQSMDRSSCLDNGSTQLDPSGEPAEKVSKNVSFEYDKELEEGAYGGTTADSLGSAAAEMRDKMEWIERTYNTR